MHLTHVEITRSISELDDAIKRRLGAEQPKQTEAERLVCIRSRSLYSTYVDVLLWSGVDKAVVQTVREALVRARECLQTDRKCIESVERRVKDFEKFTFEQQQSLVQS